MATEPTLGELVKQAIDEYPCWPSADYPMRLAKLRALCARADAAERLAVAVGDADLRGLHCAHLGKGRVSVDEDEWRRECVAIESINNALAAWRALGEVDG